MKQEALFPLHFIPASRLGSYVERVVAGCIRETEIQPNSEVCRVPARPPSNLVDPAAVPESMVQ
jgi:hypothetical protein